METKYKKGQRVSILNQTLSGKPIIEGEAILKQFVSRDDWPPHSERWKVRFIGETELFERNIVP